MPRIDNTSDEEYVALLAKLRDQEGEIAFLHRQQRDVRFLVKQLAKEVQLRLNKRAKQTVTYSGLVYAPDGSIEHMLQTNNEDDKELLEFIHRRDKANIRLRHQSFTAVLRPIPWKVAAGMFTASIIVAKQAAKRLR